MSPFEWLTLGLGILATLLIPTLVLLVKGTVRWTRTEDQIGTLIAKVTELVEDKDKVHAEILEQMRVDRDATDRRLRFMEEFWMRKGQGQP